jgi:predicted nucleic acid-binding protein
VLRRYELRRELDEERCTAALTHLAELRIVRYPTLDLLARAWDLRRNTTAYDAVYVALAEALDTELVTTDARLAAAARAHTNLKVVLLV